MTNKILVLGSSGLVGSRFTELFSRPELLLTPDETQFNLLNLDSLSKYLTENQTSIIVNFAAFTDVNAAEVQRDDKTGLCWQINVTGLQNLLSLINTENTHFIQISTDMVFSGNASDPGPYSEDHLPESDPQKLNWYGYTKAQAEGLLDKNSTILRICNPVRAKFPGKLDYFRKPMSLYDAGKLYPLFTDQRVTISYVDEICQALNLIISDRHLGIFHVSSSDSTTPYDIISYLLSEVRHVESAVVPTTFASLPNGRYPQFSGLKCLVTQATLGLNFSPVKRIVNQLISQGLEV